MASESASTLVPAQREWVQGPDGAALSVWEWGNPTGPELLFVHGVAQSHLAFTRQRTADLAASCRVVAYDLLGHGDSDKPVSSTRYCDSRQWADELALVIRAKKLHRPILVGWSLGGRIVRQYLVRYGDAAIAGVNFVSSRVIEDPRYPGRHTRTISAEPAPALPDRIRSAIAFLDVCFHEAPDEAHFREALAYNMLVPHEIRLAIARWATDPAETIANLRRISVPVLVTHGIDDQVIPVAIARMVAETVNHARLSLYEKCGHAPFFEHAPRFNRELVDFVHTVLQVF